jgi:hypothetical protein
MKNIFVILLCFIGLSLDAQSFEANKVLLGANLSSIYYHTPITFDEVNNKYLAGIYDGLFSVQGKSVVSSKRSIFLIKLDSRDSVLWIKNISTYPIGNKMVGRIELKAFKKDLYLDFHFIDSIMLFNSIFQSKGASDVILVKLNHQGQKQYIKQISGNSDVFLGYKSMAIDVNKNLYLIGGFGNLNSSDSLFLNTDTLISSGRNIYLIKLDSSGQEIWVKSQGGNGLYAGLGVQIVGNNLYTLNYISNGSQLHFDTINKPYPIGQYTHLAAVC